MSAPTSAVHRGRPFTSPGGPKPGHASRLGLFGMVSEECLERVRDHVAPIKGLHPWTAQALYAALAVCASRQGTASAADGQRCWVSVAELAARTGMCRRNVERYLPVLQDAGVLRIVRAHDALHRPVASHYVFVYPRSQVGDAPTPRSGYSAAPVGGAADDATPESEPADSRVGTVLENQEESLESDPDDSIRGAENDAGTRAESKPDGPPHNDGGTPVGDTKPIPGATRAAGPPRGTHPAAEGAWEAARIRLAGQLSAAAFQAWLAPLRVVGAGPHQVGGDGASTAGPPPLAPSTPGATVLACASGFQRDQVERRYRRLLEEAMGGPVVLVVRPAGGPGTASAPGVPVPGPGSAHGATQPSQGR